MGIFNDESNEVKRALDLLLFPLFSLLKEWNVDINPDGLRPIGDVKIDDGLRVTKGMFLDLIVFIMMVKMEEKLSKVGSFLLNYGYELPPEKDIFPNAARIAERVFQLQFIPGELLSFDGGEPYAENFRPSNSTDAVISFATIPVFPAGDSLNIKPEGYQYLLGLELNPGNFGTEAGDFNIAFPANISKSFIWGHQTKFHSFGNSILGAEPLIQIQWKKAKVEENENTETDGVRDGDVFLKIHPRKKMVDNKEELDAEISMEFHDFSLTLSGEGRDGFIQKILPDKGVSKINISLSMVYSPLLNKWSVTGFDKNDGFLFLFAIGKTLFGKIEIPTLYIGLKPLVDEGKSLRGVELESSAMLKLLLGPFQMTVDRLGLYLALDFSKKVNKNLGFANLDVGLKPPSGVGFLVDAVCIKGGGFLSIDPENHQYYGAGELSIKFEKFKLTLKVVAIILTQLPDGKKGFSFLLLATVEFNPGFDTAFGFKITGVGVMVALHRSMNLEAFQQAVRDDRFNSILFPDNPVGNAPTIVKALNSLFPPVQDRYVFAIMARIGWGTRKLVDIKLGLLIEVPSPVKLALAGVIKVTIDKGSVRILNLQVNFLVALDLGRKIFSIDAAIYNSRLLIFDIRGEMFVRFRWGQDAMFLFAIGGWHPDFQVPSGLNLPAKPQRVTVPLLKSENPSLILSCYFAFTSNTAQAGFLIDFKMKWSKFRLEAGLSMDALFHFDPFYFVVDYEGKLRIFWGDSRLAGVTVKGKFSGTNPWRIRGTASFEIWIWDYEVDFDKSSGEEITTISQEVEVLPLIDKAISENENWISSLPPGQVSNVILRNTTEDLKSTPSEAASTQPILADPLSRIEIIQQVTPLGIRIDKLGFQRVKGARKFDIAAETSGGNSLIGKDLDDHFAPAMFIEMEDAEKISRKSFEPMKAGRSFGDLESLSAGFGQISSCDYDNEFYDPLTPEVKPPSPPISTINFHRWIGNNAVAKSEAGRKLISEKEIDRRKKISPTNPFVLADALTGNRITEVIGQKNMTAAYYEVWKLQKLNPLRKINVVRESEIIS